LLEKYPWWRFEPHPEWGEPDGFAAGIPGEVRFLYQPKRGIYNWNGTIVKRLQPHVPYHAYYFNPVSAKKYDLKTFVSPGPAAPPFAGHTQPLIFADQFDKPDGPAWKDDGTPSQRKNGRLIGGKGMVTYSTHPIRVTNVANGKTGLWLYQIGDRQEYDNCNRGRSITVLPRTRREDTTFRKRLTRGEVTWRHIMDKVDDEGEVIDRFSSLREPTLSQEGFRIWWFHSTRKAELDTVARAGRINRATYESELFRQERRGRPTKDPRDVRQVRTFCSLEFELDQEAIARDRTSDGVFPRITNVESLTALDVLEAYKKQPLVENRFSQLKTDFRVAPVYLTSVARIEALLCVYVFVMMTQALFGTGAASGDGTGPGRFRSLVPRGPSVPPPDGAAGDPSV